ncbi:MAG: hypothetical protein H5T98_03840 [Syntrophomonadaceae bacterium]|nr:hypothetical protein [Syntrophomonadaceae bacterium]
MEIFKIFLRIPSVVRAIYFLRIWGYKFYTVIPISKAINQNGYKEKIGKAIRSITKILNDNKNLKTEILGNCQESCRIFFNKISSISLVGLRAT